MHEEIERALAQTPDALLAQLGGELLRGGLQVEEPTDEEKREEALHWLQGRQDLRGRICGSALRSVLRGGTRPHDLVLVAAGLADLIGSLTLGVSPITVAVLVAKLGLDSYCEGP